MSKFEVLSIRLWSKTDLLHSVSLAWNSRKFVWWNFEESTAKNWALTKLHVLWFTLSYSRNT